MNMNEIADLIFLQYYKRERDCFNTKDCIEIQNILSDLQYLKDNMDMRNGKV